MRLAVIVASGTLPAQAALAGSTFPVTDTPTSIADATTAPSEIPVAEVSPEPSATPEPADTPPPQPSPSASDTIQLTPEEDPASGSARSLVSGKRRQLRSAEPAATPEAVAPWTVSAPPKDVPSSPSTASAASTLYVGPGGGTGACLAPPFSSIQTAMNGAAAGDTIHICAGTYRVPEITTSKETYVRRRQCQDRPPSPATALLWPAKRCAASVTISEAHVPGGGASDPGQPIRGAMRRQCRYRNRLGIHWNSS